MSAPDTSEDPFGAAPFHLPGNPYIFIELPIHFFLNKLNFKKKLKNVFSSYVKCCGFSLMQLLNTHLLCMVLAHRSEKATRNWNRWR